MGRNLTAVIEADDSMGRRKRRRWKNKKGKVVEQSNERRRKRRRSSFYSRKDDKSHKRKQSWERERERVADYFIDGLAPSCLARLSSLILFLVFLSRDCKGTSVKFETSTPPTHSLPTGFQSNIESIPFV